MSEATFNEVYTPQIPINRQSKPHSILKRANSTSKLANSVSSIKKRRVSWADNYKENVLEDQTTKGKIAESNLE